MKVGAVLAQKQDKPSQFETLTEGYSLLNAGLGFKIKVKNQLISISVQANNISDTKYFDHLYTLKSLGIYNMGRNISFSVHIPIGLKNK